MKPKSAQSQNTKLNPKSSYPKTKTFNNKKLNDRFLVYAILLLISLIYLRVFSNHFTNWDDNYYILTNPYLEFSYKNIKDIFSHYYMGNYHPITMLFYSIAHSIGGTNPWIYQLFNLTLHLGNTFLVFTLINLLLKQSDPKNTHHLTISLITSLLFGVHTLQSESVVWMSELKTLLYAFFFLVSLICYLKYTESGRNKYLINSLVFFIVSILSKATAVSLLLCLPLIDYMVNRPVLSRKHILEKIPFFLISLSFGLIAISAQDKALSGIGSSFSFIERIAFASYAFFMYLVKLLLPVNLSAFYCYPLRSGYGIPGYFYLFPFIVMSMIACIYFAFRNNKRILFGFTFFLVNLFLVLQILPVGDAIMADRYVYVSSIGLFFIFGNLFVQIHKSSLSHRFCAWLGLAVYISVLLVLTHNRIGIWKDSITLWGDVIKKSPNTFNYKAFYNRGLAFNGLKNYQSALDDCSRAIQLNPQSSDAFYNRGNAFSGLKKYPDALNDYTRAILLNPKNSDAFFNRGLARIDMNMPSEALNDFSEAIKLKSGYIEAISARALARVQLKDNKGAMIDLNTSIALKTSNPDVYVTRGYLISLTGDYAKSLLDYNKAVELNPKNLIYYKARAISETRLKLYKEAINDLNIVLQSTPDPMAYYFRGYSKHMLNLADGGCEDIRQAKKLGYLEIDPELVIGCNL